MIAWVWLRIAPYVLGLGAILTVAGTVFLKGRATGKRVVTDQIRKQNDKLERKFDEIDSQRPDLDASLDRLSKRARRRGRRSS